MKHEIIVAFIGWLTFITLTSIVLPDRIIYIENDCVEYIEVTPDYQVIATVPKGSPVDGVLVSEYGYRLHPIYNQYKFHKGIDLAAPLNSVITSTAYGIVESIEYKPDGYGLNVTVDHGGIIKTRYAHLNKIFIKQGQQLCIGDTIGTVGSSGTTTGNHLHYEVIIMNIPVDPVDFL